MKKRLMIIKYEDLVTNPNLYLKKICKFLQINFNKNMINPNKYYDFVTKKIGYHTLLLIVNFLN